MITQTTITTIRQFCKPAIDAGVIPADQFRELITLAKQDSGGAAQAATDKRMLTVAQVADQLQCSTKTVHRMKTSGRLPGTYLTASRKSLRFSQKALDALIEEGTGND
jgi:excisionase family DNA binding protein